MRRTPFVLAATAAGLAGVLSYHTHAKSFGSFNPSVSHAGATPKQAQSRTSTTVSPGRGTVTPPVTPYIGRQGTGPLVQYGYGILAVKVTLLGPKITSVGVVGLRTGSQYSAAIAQQAVPILRSEVLQLQSANINGVSGATYTSEAFAMSLQHALQHLHP